MRSGQTTTQDSVFSSPIPAPTPRSDPPTNSLGPDEQPPHDYWKEFGKGYRGAMSLHPSITAVEKFGIPNERWLEQLAQMKKN